jgi:hypothetical protein
MIQVDFSWTAYLEDIYAVDVYPDTTDHNMYLLDDIGNRYDHLNTGGDASRIVPLTNSETAYGWYFFPPLAEDANYITFYDDDNQVNTQPILIRWP